MNKKYVFYLLFIFYILPIKNEYVTESITDISPKYLIIDQVGNFFKIYNYSVICDENIEYADIALNMSETNDYLLYVYDDYKKIHQDENGEFQGANYSEFWRQKFAEYKNLICGKNYYFVFYLNTTNYYDFIPYQIIIYNQQIDIFDISPQKSDIFSISPRQKRK